MPTIFFHCPKLNEDQKREAVDKMAQIGSDITGIRKEAFVVYLEEKDPENVGVGGVMLKDKYAQNS